MSCSPAAKYDSTNGLAAWIGFMCVYSIVMIHVYKQIGRCDEGFKASAYLTETYTNAQTKYSLDPSHASFQRGLNTDLHFFSWLESTNKAKRFGVAMIAGGQWAAPDAILQGIYFDDINFIYADKARLPMALTSRE